MSYEDEGYHISRGRIRSTTLLKLLGSFLELLPRKVNHSSYERISACTDAELYNASVTVGSSLSAYEVLVEVLGDLWTPTIHVMPLHVSVQRPGVTKFDYDWHQESAFYPKIKHITNMWFPIAHPTDDTTGSLKVIPGSHVGGKRTSTTSNAGGYRQIVPYVDSEELRHAVTIHAGVGDLVVFDEHTVHGTAPNVSSRPRLTGIIRLVDMQYQDAIRPMYKAIPYEV